LGAALSAGAADPLTTQRLSGVAPRLQELVDSRQICGAAFLVAHNGEAQFLKAVGQHVFTSMGEAAVRQYAPC
jgi:hypothetical protein